MRASSEGILPKPGSGKSRWIAFGRTAFCCCMLLPAAAGHALAQEASPPINLMGAAGIVDMTSARMVPDGTLSVGASFFSNTQHYYFSFQALPWLETSFRYSGLQHFDPSYPVYYDRSFAFKARLWDEDGIWPAVAVGVNDMIGTGIYGGEYVVASKRVGALDLSVGMGWGRLGTANTFENPLDLLSSSFSTPRSGTAAAGGVSFKTLFHGPTAGVFGGVSWQTPVNGLTLSAELSSDAYSREAAAGSFRPRSQWNFGLGYRPWDSTVVNLDWLYGSTLAAGLVFQIDPVHESDAARLGPQPPVPRTRTAEEQQQALRALHGNQAPGSAPQTVVFADQLWGPSVRALNASIQGELVSVDVAGGDLPRICSRIADLAIASKFALAAIEVSAPGGRHAQCRLRTPAAPMATSATLGIEPSHAGAGAFRGVITIDATAPAKSNGAAAIAAIRKEATAQGLSIQAIALKDGVAKIYYYNGTFRKEQDALERLSKILMNEAPADIEEFQLTNVIGGVPQREFDLLRAPIEREMYQSQTFDVLGSGVESYPAPLSAPELAAAQRGTYPRLSWSIFPQLRQQLFDPNNPFALQLLATVGATVELLPGLSVQGAFEGSIINNFNVNRASDSILPHVRTDYVKYFAQGKTGIGQLDLEYRFRMAPNVFGILKAGYLESMFAGAGGELLWRPEGERWALGADLYEVEQRDFNRLFGLQSYRITTGHLSFYYATPWYGLNFTTRIGRYLAGDYGATMEISRRFATGVEIGAFFTKTNVSAQQFGEGSFDKGITIRIPLDFALPLNTQGEFGMNLRAVQRDGGQRLWADAVLYDDTSRASPSDFNFPALHFLH